MGHSTTHANHNHNNSFPTQQQQQHSKQQHSSRQQQQHSQEPSIQQLTLSSSGFEYPLSGDESDNHHNQMEHLRSQFYTPDPQKRTKEYHMEQSMQAIEHLKVASRPDGWKKIDRHKSGCTVYQSTTATTIPSHGDHKYPAFKGEHVIHGHKAQDVFAIVGVRKLWDDWYDELSCVETYDDATNLMYMVMKGTLSSKTRDVSMVERTEIERDGTIYFAACSVDSTKIPRIPGKHRAEIFLAGWIIQPLPSNPPITKVTYVIQTDLLNRLPKFIAKRSLAKRALVATVIETYLKKNGSPSTNVATTTTRPRSLSEPLKLDHFLIPPDSDDEDLGSGSNFPTPIHNANHADDEEEEESTEDEAPRRQQPFYQAAPTSKSPAATARSSLMSNSLFSQEFIDSNPHSETARKALAMFKVLASSPEDRWRAISSENGFKSYSRVISGAGLPMLRSEGTITGGWTVEQINAVIESSGCRTTWDERFENLSIAETFNHNEYLFHVTLKGVGSITGRDLAGVTIVDRDPMTSALYNVSTSVLDPTIPEDPGRIRAMLELSGWSLRPTFDGQGNTVSVNVTFVVQVDIRGTLPSSVVKTMTASMTTAVPRLNQFINKTGYPPFASHISGTRLLDTFDPTSGFYELCY
ncbi:hypothetical protein F5H01DRAFT_271168, partial [Linnemannia elongata]